MKLFRETARLQTISATGQTAKTTATSKRIFAELSREKQGYDEELIKQALFHELEKAAGDTSKSLYDRNRAVYDLLRYGVKVSPDVGENKVNVWLVDWEQPENNDFAIAEEVAVAAASRQSARQTP